MISYEMRNKLSSEELFKALVSDAIKQSLEVQGYAWDVDEIASIFSVSPKRAKNLIEGKSHWSDSELHKLRGLTGIGRVQIHAEANERMKELFAPQIELEELDLQDEQVQAFKKLGKSIAADVWNLAEQPVLLEMLLQERLRTGIDSQSKVFSSEVIQAGIIEAFQELASQLRITFPGRIQIEGSSPLS